MSISVNCPTCGKSYNLNESMVGKKVRCKHCADTFPVELDAVLPANGAVPGAGALRSHDQPERHRLPEVLPLGDGDNPSSDEEDEKEPAKAGGFPWGWCLAGGGVLLVLLICGGLVGGVSLIVYNVVQTANNISNNISTVAANNPANRPTNSPQTVGDALADLQSNDVFRKQRGAEWLAKTPSNAADQARVARALEPLLTDFNPFIKGAAANALVNWGDTNSVPALVRCVETDDPHTGDAAVKALVKLRDVRGVPPIAKQLANGWKRGNAVNALQSLGPICEAEVVKYLFHPDNGTRADAQRLLKGYGTKDSVILPQALAELKNADVNRRSLAAAWLGQTTVIAARRAEVSGALDPLLRDPNPAVRVNAVKATLVWGTKDNVPALINFVNDMFAELRPPQETYQAIEMLIGFKDERAYWPIARYVNHPFEHAKGRAYLQQLGTAAEPEVAKHLTDPNNNTRQAAWKALAVAGSKANLPAYQRTALSESDGFAQILARDALKAIAGR